MVRLRASTIIASKLTERFQFQYGAIKRVGIVDLNWIMTGFNSNMVRLRVKALYLQTKATLFQFQYGAIKSVIQITKPHIALWFQFQYGAIKSKNLSYDTRRN